MGAPRARNGDRRLEGPDQDLEPWWLDTSSLGDDTGPAEGNGGQAATVPASGNEAPVSASGNGGPAATVPASGNQLIDGLLDGTRWTGATITYTDPDSPDDYQPGYFSDDNGNKTSAQNEGFGRISSDQLLAVHFALSETTFTQPKGGTGFSVEAFTNLGIDYGTPGAGTGTIRVANTSDTRTGYAFFPQTTSITAGDVWMGTTAQSAGQGNYGWHGILHELGHALGLKHAHETGGPANTALPSNVDSVEFTVMAYRSYVGGPATGGYTNEQWGHPQTYMMLDIAALQYMYGADFSSSTANVGDTTYTWSPTNGQSFVNGVLATNPGGNRIFETIWDGGGTDTYDLSNYTTPMTIDLAPGSSSNFSPKQLALLNRAGIANLWGSQQPDDVDRYQVMQGDSTHAAHPEWVAIGNVFNALQFQNDPRSLIENAVGGSAGDIINGNTAANDLKGGGGPDALRGRTGNDTIDGGTGWDTAVFQGVSSAYTITDMGGGMVRVAGPDGIDTLSKVERLFFNDNPNVIVASDLSAGNLALNGRTISWRISNAGYSSPLSTTGLYLSTDSLISSADTLLAIAVTPGLATGGGFNDSLVLTDRLFPTTLEPGTYYLGVLADSSENIDEVIETNNAASIPFTFVRGLAGTVAISDASVTEGQGGTKIMNFTVTATRVDAPFAVNYSTADGTATTGDAITSRNPEH